MLASLNLSIASGNNEYESVFRVNKPEYYEGYFRIDLTGLTWYAHTGKRKRKEESDDAVGFDMYLSGNNLIVMLIYADNTSEVIYGDDFCQYRWTVKPWANVYKGFPVHENRETIGITTYDDVKTILVAPNKYNGLRYLNIKYPEE